MVEIEIKAADIEKAIDPLYQMEQNSKQAIKEINKRMRSQLNPIVRDVVQKEYPGIKAGQVSKAFKGVKDEGDKCYAEYTGTVISPSGYTWSPKSDAGRRSDYSMAKHSYVTQFSAPRRGGSWGDAVQVHQPNPYSITVKIKNGGTFPAGSNFFAYGGSLWKRKSEKPRDIKKVTTLSVPTAILNAAKSEIETKCADKAEEVVGQVCEEMFGN